jgi:hypothetical protein
MEPGADAVMSDGWYVWHPNLPAQQQISLAASGATASAWGLCHAGGCTELGVSAGETAILRACEK